jgi:hypothetical protein
MGRAAKDGSFEEFQAQALALEPEFGELSIKSATLRGETVAFGWEGPLSVDGKEEPITGFKHYDGPYCEVDWPAEQMDIRLGEQVLRLEFGS